MPAAKQASDRATSSASPVSGSGVVGVAALVSVAAANVALWVFARPAGQPAGQFLGELCGSEAVLLFSCALVLATLLGPIERAFGGLDRVARWHRHAATSRSSDSWSWRCGRSRPAFARPDGRDRFGGWRERPTSGG